MFFLVAEQINQVAGKVGISPEELDKPCAEYHLLPISQKLVNWTLYAMHLGLERAEIHDIQTNRRYHSSQEEGYAMLQKWCQRYGGIGRRATYRHLLQGCVTLRDLLVAMDICEILRNVGQASFGHNIIA